MTQVGTLLRRVVSVSDGHGGPVAEGSGLIDDRCPHQNHRRWKGGESCQRLGTEWVLIGPEDPGSFGWDAGEVQLRGINAEGFYPMLSPRHINERLAGFVSRLARLWDILTKMGDGISQMSPSRSGSQPSQYALHIG